MSFQDKVVIVTGGGKGIGRAVARMYAEKGAKVVIADINQQDGEETQRFITGHGGNSTFVLTDVSNPVAIAQLMEQVEQLFGKLDILINNAGISAWKSPYQLEVDEWDRIINTNLRSVFLCSRAAAKIMKKHGGGFIINLSSTRAHMSEPNTEAYAASKGGILALTHAMAVSFGPDNIRVNALSPGWIETGNYEALSESDHLQHPALRVGKPDDIARACLFLTNGENDFITGAELVIDGGMTRKMIYEP